MASTAPACMHTPIDNARGQQLTTRRYNGTSDLQLERMNVYFNEV